jgi:hypothetical protein
VLVKVGKFPKQKRRARMVWADRVNRSASLDVVHTLLTVIYVTKC